MAAFGTGPHGLGIYGIGLDAPVVLDTIPDDVPPDVAAPLAGDPQLTIVGTNGDRVVLKITDDDYAALQGATGFGIPPKVLTITEGAGDGGVVRYTRTGLRDIDLPIGIFGTSRGGVLERQRRLASALRTRPGKPPARLQFSLESGDVFETVVHYVAGAETQITPDAGGAVFCRWPVTLRAPDPYWTAINEVPFLLAATAGPRGLLPSLSRLQLAASQVLGDATITNPGDVDADIVWQITGPGGPFTATNDLGDGFVIEDTLTGGETITVDTRTGAVTDQTGADRYTSLGAAPKLFKLPDGTSTVHVSLTGATSDSRVVGRYRPRREVVY